MKLFYNLIMCVSVCSAFLFQEQMIHADNESLSNQQGSYLDTKIVSKTLKTKIQSLEGKNDAFGYHTKVGYLFISDQQDFGAGVSYYREVGEKKKEADGKKKYSYKRGESTLDFYYTKKYQLSDGFKLLTGIALNWKFQTRDQSNSDILVSSILNASSEQAAPLQVHPYFGASLKLGSSGKALAKMIWNQYLFQHQSYKVGGGSKKEQSVVIKGGHSLTLKGGYGHDILESLKASAWTEYNLVIFPRSGTYPVVGNLQDKSYENIRGHRLTLGGQVSLDITKSLSIEAWGAYDLIGKLEYKLKSPVKNTERGKLGLSLPVLDGVEYEENSLSGGINLGYRI